MVVREYLFNYVLAFEIDDEEERQAVIAAIHQTCCQILDDDARDPTEVAMEIKNVLTLDLRWIYYRVEVILCSPVSEVTKSMCCWLIDLFDRLAVDRGGTLDAMFAVSRPALSA
jgi:hypothetical protein